MSKLIYIINLGLYLFFQVLNPHPPHRLQYFPPVWSYCRSTWTLKVHLFLFAESATNVNRSDFIFWKQDIQSIHELVTCDKWSVVVTF